MKKVTPTAVNKQFRKEWLALLDRFSGAMPAEEMLAVASYTVGQMLAMQDQSRFTGPMCMEIVARNIQAGNDDAVQSLMDSKGSA